MKNKKALIMLGLVLLIGIVGTTLAYFTSQDTFTNLFRAGIYKTEVTETFVSPTNWAPGDTTPKTVNVTNKGDVDVAVRVHMVEEWKDKNNNPLPLKSDNKPVAIINYADDLSKWTSTVESGTEYFYYNVKLGPNETTTNLIESVTFNSDAPVNKETNCTTEGSNTICTNTYTDYAGGTYKLTIIVETAQYDSYQTIWSTGEIIDSSIQYAYGFGTVNNGVLVGNTYPTSTEIEDSPFFRFRLSNGLVREVALGFRYNNNEYYLVGSGNNYESNRSIVTSIMGEENCYADMIGSHAVNPNLSEDSVEINKVGSHDFEDGLICDNSNCRIKIYKDGRVDYNKHGSGCRISGGSPDCYLD